MTIYKAVRNFLTVLVVLAVAAGALCIGGGVYYAVQSAASSQVLSKLGSTGAEVTRVQKKLKELGLKVKSRPVELGYEIRCQTPIAYDLTYCSELGIGAHKLFAEGKTGCMVYVDSEGNVSPLYLKDLQDPTTGKIPPRLVDIKSDKFTSVVETILNAITPADYEAAKAYVPNPEEYDFHKILNWK